jgi:hypothetical protein
MNRSQDPRHSPAAARGYLVSSWAVPWNSWKLGDPQSSPWVNHYEVMVIHDLDDMGVPGTPPILGNLHVSVGSLNPLPFLVNDIAIWIHLEEMP